MNRFKDIIAYVFNFNAVMLIVMGILAIITMTITISVIFLDVIFSSVVSIPFIIIFSAYLLSEIRRLILKYRLELILRNRELIEENNRIIYRNDTHLDTMRQLAELHDQMLEVIAVMEEAKIRKREHPDDVVINNIDDLYE